MTEEKDTINDPGPVVLLKAQASSSSSSPSPSAKPALSLHGDDNCQEKIATNALKIAPPTTSTTTTPTTTTTSRKASSEVPAKLTKSNSDDVAKFKEEDQRMVSPTTTNATTTRSKASNDGAAKVRESNDVPAKVKEEEEEGERMVSDTSRSHNDMKNGGKQGSKEEDEKGVPLEYLALEEEGEDGKMPEPVQRDDNLAFGICETAPGPDTGSGGDPTFRRRRRGVDSLPGAYAQGGASRSRSIVPRSQLQMDAEQNNYYDNNGVLRYYEQGGDDSENPSEVKLEAVLPAMVVDEEADLKDLRQQQQQQEQGQDLSGDIEEQVGELIEATPMPDESFLARYRKLVCLLLLLGVVGGVATIVGLVVSNSTQLSSVVSSSNQSVGPAIFPPFQEDLPGVTVKAMEDSSSPQYKANAWMWNDPYLEDHNKDHQLQRFAMVTIFYANGGSHWYNNKHWLDYEISECLWQTSHTPGSPTCDDQGNLLIADLNSNNLTGTIQKEAQYIPHFKYIDLGNNQLGGTFPPIASTDTLEVFILSNNNLEGPLAGDAGFNAPKLRVVRMDGNNLVGNYPYLYNVLTGLEVFNTSQNPIGGSIPPNVKHAKRMRHMSFQNGNYEGVIPSELGLLSDLESYDFADNPLVVGTVPTELGLLKNLTLFDISGTSIAGALPNEFCNRTSAAGYKELTIVANCSMVQCCG